MPVDLPVSGFDCSALSTWCPLLPNRNLHSHRSFVGTWKVHALHARTSVPGLFVPSVHLGVPRSSKSIFSHSWWPPTGVAAASWMPSHCNSESALWPVQCICLVAKLPAKATPFDCKPVNHPCLGQTWVPTMPTDWRWAVTSPSHLRLPTCL